MDTSDPKEASHIWLVRPGDGMETFAMAYLDDIMVFWTSAPDVRPPKKAWPEGETVKMSVSRRGDKIPRVRDK